MDLKIIYFSLLFHASLSLGAQVLPGGVSGAEVWYISDEFDINYGVFTDHSQYPKGISACDESHIEKAYFNFNPSLTSENLCLQYRASLERSLDRSMFIVSEPDEKPGVKTPYPHFGTQYNRVMEQILGPHYNDSLSMNTYVLETVQGFGSRMVTPFSQHQFANVHFYSWNNYDIDNIAKSYGRLGEMDFFVGKKILHPELSPGPYFSGLMPEYVTYDRALTENERNRVESYLALKYGITKWGTDHYLDSQNKVFWDKANNGLFFNNIFGIGRDDRSALHQLQCESAHARDFLVAATYEIRDTNAELRNDFEIADREFLVFGDTETEEVGEPTPENQHLNRLYRVWLAQVRGDEMGKVPIRFRVDLMRAFEARTDLVEHVVNEKLTLWMLHDPYVDNTYVSDFDNGRVKFYSPFSIDHGPDGEVYAFFGKDDIFFDRDNSFFDQFTFAIGPECLIQFRPRYNCDEIAESPMECYELDIIVEGNCEEHPEIFNAANEGLDIWLNYEESKRLEKLVYTAHICAPDVYTVVLQTPNGPLEFNYEAEVIEQFWVDLGPTIQYLTAQNPEIFLDAGQYMDDSKATYQWFFNGDQMYHYGDTLTVDQPGEYCVVVTTGDGVCKIERCVTVVTELEAEIICRHIECYDEYEIEIIVNDGVPPYKTTVVTVSSGQSITHLHNGNLLLSGQIPGETIEFIITVEDDVGAIILGSCIFQIGTVSGGGSLGPDLILNTSNQQYTLDASSSYNGPQNYTYEWSRNGMLLPNSNSPQLMVNSPGSYVARIYMPDKNCYGYANRTVRSLLEGTISQSNDCDVFSNSIAVVIDFGFPPYMLNITEDPGSGGGYVFQQGGYTGNFTMNGIPYGNHTVTVIDKYGSHILENVLFMDPMIGVKVDLIQYLDDDEVVQVCYHTPLEQNILCDCCDMGAPNYIEIDGNPGTILDASQEITNPYDYTFEWFKNGVSTGIYTPQVFIGTIPPYGSGIDEYMVRVSHVSNGCFIEDSFFAYGFFGIMEYVPPVAPRYTTTVYPNPSGSDATFYYRISTSSLDVFDGTVELYNILGQLLFSNPIRGQTEYTLPYTLVASGAYIIRTTLADGTVKVDRVIIK